MSSHAAATAGAEVNGGSSSVAPVAKGWGSFQSPSVELLIHQSGAEYRAPALPPFATEGITPDHLVAPETDNDSNGANSVVASSSLGRAACLQSAFLLDPAWTFINHGAFGATLRPMLQVRNEWSNYMERQPLRFLDRELLPLLVHVTREMAAFVGCPPTSLTLHANATTALNVLIRSLRLQAADKILSLSIAYGAVKKMLQSTGATVVQLDVPLPLRSRQVLLDVVAAALDAPEHAGQWKLAVFDHVASNSAILLPLQELTALCHARGVPVLVDGAHSLGSVPLRLEESRVDYYVSNTHKWLCNPKGAAIMYVDPRHQSMVRPLVISHGTGSGYVSDFIWTGCQDYAPLLTLMSTLRFWSRFGGVERAVRHNHALVMRAGRYLARRWGTEMLVGADDPAASDSDPVDEEASALSANMVCVRLPGPLDPVHSDEHNEIQNALHYEHAIEVPIKVLGTPPRLWMRVSAMIYNDMADYERVGEVMWQMRGAGQGEATKEAGAAAAAAAAAATTAAAASIVPPSSRPSSPPSSSFAVAVPPSAASSTSSSSSSPASAPVMLHPDHTQVCIPPGAESLSLARDFYVGVLQMREVVRPVEMDGRPGMWLHCGQGEPARANVHIGVESLPADHYAKSKAHIAYAVRGLDAWERRLRGRGCPIVPGLKVAGMERFDSRDPFGNKIEFIEYADSSPAVDV